MPTTIESNLEDGITPIKSKHWKKKDRENVTITLINEDQDEEEGNIHIQPLDPTAHYSRLNKRSTPYRHLKSTGKQVAYKGKQVASTGKHGVKQVANTGKQGAKKISGHLIGSRRKYAALEQAVDSTEKFKPCNTLAVLQQESDPDLKLQKLHEIEEGVMDTLIEHQRGWFLFGYPLFSSNSLMPGLDPHAWTTKEGKAIYGDASAYMLPDVTWKWQWKRWYVDMSMDVDDQGWQYSIRFGSSSWHGTHIWFHSFVRKRVWVRLRTKRPVDEINKQRWLIERQNFDIRAIPEQEEDDDDETSQEPASPDVSALLVQLQKARLDRERIKIVCKFVQCDDNPEAVMAAHRYVDEILELFDHDDSRVHLQNHLQAVATANPHLQQFVELVTMQNQKMGYYSDNTTFSSNLERT